MRYQLKPIFCRPWLLNGLSLKLTESHYENNYGGALRRLNAITEQLESLDFAKTPGYVLNGLKRDEMVALNSTLLHELYFASLGGEGKPTGTMADALARDFGSVDRWRSEFVAMGNALGGGSGWVLLVYVPRDRRLVNQFAAEHSQVLAGGIPLAALDMYEHAYHMDFGANVKAYVDAGGVLGIHSHDDRPDVSYLVQGSLTELRAGGYVKERANDTLHSAGKGVTHWVENRGNGTAVLIVADVFKTP
jgi:superoxide dismutase, Fe-Mn family